MVTIATEPKRWRHAAFNLDIEMGITLPFRECGRATRHKAYHHRNERPCQWELSTSSVQRKASYNFVAALAVVPPPRESLRFNHKDDIAGVFLSNGK